MTCWNWWRAHWLTRKLALTSPTFKQADTDFRPQSSFFRIVPQQKQTWASVDCGLCFFLPKQEPTPLAKSCWGHPLQPKLGLDPITAASAIPTLHPTAASAWALHLTHWAAQKQNQTNMSDRTNSPLIFLFQVSPSWRDKVRRRLSELSNSI